LPRKSTKRKPALKPRVALGPEEAELVGRLAERTRLPPREILERALAAYAAAVAPGMPAVSTAAAKARRGARPRVFVSVEGRPEVEIKKTEFVFGRDPSCDIALDVALLSPRHARVLLREGEPVFEDLRSQRGSYQHGEKVDVKAIRDGDEFDLGGFVPVRFRVAGKAL
jgi:pSer/pThr/pTyr-binding forkhead associated (FHA) protein